MPKRILEEFRPEELIEKRDNLRNYLLKKIKDYKKTETGKRIYFDHRLSAIVAEE